MGAPRLSGKRALITGANRGIGAEIAIALACEGAGVLLNYPTDTEREEAEEVEYRILRRGGESECLQANLEDPREIQELVGAVESTYGGVDILVNNAGVCIWRPPFTSSLAVWERTLAVNSRAVYLCSLACARAMIDRGVKGSIVSVGSVAAYTGSPRQVEYSASKAAVGAIMRSLAVALGPAGIRCNTVLPGCIETALNSSVLADAEERSGLVARTPLRRLGRPKDVAGAVVFLASDESSFCTGCELVVDGGISIQG